MIFKNNGSSEAASRGPSRIPPESRFRATGRYPRGVDMSFEVQNIITRPTAGIHETWYSNPVPPINRSKDRMVNRVLNDSELLNDSEFI